MEQRARNEAAATYNHRPNAIHSFVGQKFSRKFSRKSTLGATILREDDIPGEGLNYFVKYDDGEKEHLNFKELAFFLARAWGGKGSGKGSGKGGGKGGKEAKKKKKPSGPPELPSNGQVRGPVGAKRGIE